MNQSDQRGGITPGPWRLRNEETRGGIWVDAPEAIVKNSRGPSYARQILEDEEYPEKLADARAIAKVPEMIAALEAAKERFDGMATARIPNALKDICAKQSNELRSLLAQVKA